MKSLVVVDHSLQAFSNCVESAYSQQFQGCGAFGGLNNGTVAAGAVLVIVKLCDADIVPVL